MKVVINACYGGFSLSRRAFLQLREMGNEHAKKEPDYGPRTKSALDRDGSFLRDIPRDDPQLVEVVERLGNAANGAFAGLKVVEVPDDAKWEIAEYDGYEHVAEVHRTWS